MCQKRQLKICFEYVLKLICQVSLFCQKAIAGAKTLGEVEKLQAMLAVNQVPGLAPPANGASNGG